RLRQQRRHNSPVDGGGRPRSSGAARAFRGARPVGAESRRTPIATTSCESGSYGNNVHLSERPVASRNPARIPRTGAGTLPRSAEFIFFVTHFGKKRRIALRDENNNRENTRISQRGEAYHGRRLDALFLAQGQPGIPERSRGLPGAPWESRDTVQLR